MSDVRRLSPEEALKLMTDEGYRYLDVRTEAEFDGGHPKGAHNIPFMLAGPAGMVKNPDFMHIVKAVYPNDARLVVGCKSGGRSLKAVTEMMAAGYTNLVDQRAGFEGTRNAFGKLVEGGWSTQGLPSEQKTAGGSYAELKDHLPRS